METNSNLSQTAPNSGLEPRKMRNKRRQDKNQSNLMNQSGSSTKTAKNKLNHWTSQEQKLYIKFLEDNGQMLRYKSVRKEKHVFILLSEKMRGLRTPTQCKRHHQKMKMVTQNGSIKEIIAYVKQKNILKQIEESKYLKSTEPKKPQMQEEKRDFEVSWVCRGKLGIKIDMSMLGSW